MKNFEFTCSCCGEIHEGIPNFGTEAPIYFYYIPENEREERTLLTSDTCVIDDTDYFVNGCLEMAVEGYDEVFSYNAWVSLSEANFFKFQDLLDVKERDTHEPMVGWFSTWIYPFEDTEKLKAKIHFRNNGTRPFIELEPTEHPLAKAQRNGITVEQIKKIYEYYVHGVEK
jgi:hypothetical protein